MATMFLVQSLILVIGSPRSHLTPISAASLHVSPKSSISGCGEGLSAGDRKGNASLWAVVGAARLMRSVWGDD